MKYQKEPKTDMKNELHWIHIMDFNIEGFARMATQILTENEIPHMLKRDVLAAAYGLGAGGVGSLFHLYVPVEFADRAEKLLDHTGDEIDEP